MTQDDWHKCVFEFGRDTPTGRRRFHGKNAKVIQPGIELLHEGIRKLLLRLLLMVLKLAVLLVVVVVAWLAFDLMFSLNPCPDLLLLLVAPLLMHLTNMLHTPAFLHLTQVTPLFPPRYFLTVAMGVMSLRVITL